MGKERTMLKSSLFVSIELYSSHIHDEMRCRKISYEQAIRYLVGELTPPGRLPVVYVDNEPLSPGLRCAWASCERE